MTKYSGISGVLSVAHNTPDGVTHGHSYEITAWYRHGHDARALKRQLSAVLQPLDHTILPDDIKWAEELAEHIGKALPGCFRVDADRPLEGLFAKWERDP